VKLVSTLLFSLFFATASAERTPTWKDRARVKTLENIDLLLNWSISRHYPPYPLSQPVDQEQFDTPLPALRTFASRYSYFSLTTPLIGKVSSTASDLKAICQCLSSLTSCSGAYFQLSQAELLTKVLAYRDLQVGQTLEIPVENKGKVSLESFTVDRVFNLWKGMPAFGLVPVKENVASLLLFRGTDFSLISQRGIASVMSDLDPKGPGLKAFFHARPEISSWLQAVARQGKPARVMGFSLGGALAAYTFIYENGSLSDEPSLSLCAPGVATTVLKAWERLPTSRKPLFISYVNAGDLVSHVGALFGTVYCLSTKIPLKPLSAHTALMSAESPLYKTRVNTYPPPHL
jgi:hypothetical protein